MDNILAMQIGKTFEDLADKVADEWLIQFAIAIQHGSHRTARYVLKEDVELVVFGVGTKVLHNVRVVEGAKEIYFATEGSDHGFFAFVDLT